MRQNWNQIPYADKLRIFKNDELLFLDKKALFLKNAKLSDAIKVLHTKLKLADSDSDRNKFANKILELDNERSKNWNAIDELIQV